MPDNRDVSVFSPHTFEACTSMSQKVKWTLDSEKLWVKMRFTLLNGLKHCFSFLDGSIENSFNQMTVGDHIEKNGTENSRKESFPMTHIINQLRNIHEELKMIQRPDQVPIMGPSEPRISSFFQQPFLEVVLNLLENVSRFRTAPNDEKVDMASSELFSTAIEKVIGSASSASYQENRKLVEVMTHCVETLCISCAIINVMWHIFHGTCGGKKGKKKKESKPDLVALVEGFEKSALRLSSFLNDHVFYSCQDQSSRTDWITRLLLEVTNLHALRL